MARLGSKRRPVMLRMADRERIAQVTKLCVDHGLQYVIELAPGLPEDLSDLERALQKTGPHVAAPKVGRNDPCACGSGKKSKRCCATDG